MKKSWKATWYNYGLTQECSRNFFTLIGAYIFARHIARKQHTQVRIKEI